MELEEIKDNLFELIHINGQLDLYNPGNASIPIKTIDGWRKNVKVLCDIATKQEKMIENIFSYFDDNRIDDNICDEILDYGAKDCIHNGNCTECIKQYFEKKAEGK